MCLFFHPKALIIENATSKFKHATTYIALFYSGDKIAEVNDKALDTHSSIKAVKKVG